MIAPARQRAAWWRDPWILAALAVALAVRIAWIWNLAGLEASDPHEYDAIGQNVARGIGFTNRGFAEPGEESWVRRPPLFPLLLGGVYRVFGHSLFAARVAQSVVGVLLCAVLVALGARFVRRPALRLLAFASALYPYLVYYCGYLMSENLAALFFYLALARLASGAGGGADIAAGALLGLAGLTRSLFLGFLAPLVIWLPGASGGIRHGARRFALVALGAALVVAPWVVRNAVVTGRFVAIQSSSVWGFYVWHVWYSQDDFPTFDFSDQTASWIRFEKRNPELFAMQKQLSDVEGDRYFREQAIRYVLEDPARYLRSCFRKLVWFWRPSTVARTGESALRNLPFWVSTLAYLVWLPVFAWGLVLLWRHGPDGRLLVWTVVYVTAFHTFYWYGSPRFRFPIYPVFLIAVAVALERAAVRFFGGRAVPGAAHAE